VNQPPPTQTAPHPALCTTRRPRHEALSVRTPKTGARTDPRDGRRRATHETWHPTCDTRSARPHPQPATDCVTPRRRRRWARQAHRPVRPRPHQWRQRHNDVKSLVSMHTADATPTFATAKGGDADLPGQGAPDAGSSDVDVDEPCSAGVDPLRPVSQRGPTRVDQTHLDVGKPLKDSRYGAAHGFVPDKERNDAPPGPHPTSGTVTSPGPGRLAQRGNRTRSGPAATAAGRSTGLGESREARGETIGRPGARSAPAALTPRPRWTTWSTATARRVPPPQCRAAPSRKCCPASTTPAPPAPSPPACTEGSPASQATSS
jgi:hypothetical protein